LNQSINGLFLEKNMNKIVCTFLMGMYSGGLFASSTGAGPGGPDENKNALDLGNLADFVASIQSLDNPGVGDSENTDSIYYFAQNTTQDITPASTLNKTLIRTSDMHRLMGGDKNKEID
jgi:hypothetical protein